MRTQSLPLLILVAVALLGPSTWAQKSASTKAPAKHSSTKSQTQKKPAAATAKVSGAASAKNAKPAQSRSGASRKASSKKGSSKKVSSKKTKRTKKRVSPARLRRVTHAFVTSANLKPMAKQLVENRTPAAYTGVEGYAKKHAGTDAGSLAWLAVSYAHILDNDFAKAEPAIQKAKAHAGELADYVSYFEALTYGGTGQSDKVVEALKDFTKKYPDSIFERDVVDIYGNALTAAGRPKEAIQYLEENRKPTRADVELALGRAYIRGGEIQKGVDILRRVYFLMPLSAQASAAGADLDALSANTSLTPISFADRKMRDQLLARANRWSDAAREYRLLLNDAPPEEKLEMTVSLGVALRRSGNLNDGRTLLEQTEATGEANAQRLYNLLEIARSEDNEARVVDLLGQIRTGNATSPWFAASLMSAGNMYLLSREYDKAIDMYRELQERFPADSRASYAHWKAAWLSFRQGRTEEAKKEFTRHVEWYPASREVPAALYWRARIAEDEGDLVTAHNWYLKCADRFKNYYYGVIARGRLVNLKSAPSASADPDPLLDKIPAITPYTEDALSEDAPQDDLRVQRAKLLENGGLVDFAIKELQDADGGKGPNWATLQIARMYQDAGQYHRALQFLKRSVPNYYSIDVSSLPRSYWELLFPRPYWIDLRRYSMQNDLDPYMVASLIRQESEFNPGALSHANAWGLMQLLPNVGKGEARELRLRRFSTEQLLVPNINLQLGTRYFKEMTNKYNGQVEYALAAYNAGSNRVDDWRSQGNFRDIAEFVESIPFTETREYVQAIVRNAEVYRLLYRNQ